MGKPSLSRFRLSSGMLVVALAIIGPLPTVVAAAPLAAASKPSTFQGSVDRADYSVSPRIGRPRSRFIATLRNEGTSTIELGRAFTIGRRTAEGWKRLRHGRNCGWPADARIIRPGDSWSQRVGLLGRNCRFRALEPGTYRVNKRIRFTDAMTSPYREATVRARFRVTA